MTTPRRAAIPQPDQQPRRHRTRTARDRAAEQTRQRILDAAVAEFGSKGYAGARTAGIATRAGVNQQLIAYYFGGKQGLLEELRRRWAQRQEILVPHDADHGQTLRAYLDATLDDPNWARLVLWQALGDGAPAKAETDTDPDGHGDGAPAIGVENGAARTQSQRITEAVDRIRQRQANGELTDTVSAQFVLLLSFMVAFAPLALPTQVRDILGVEPESTDYRDLCVEQITALLRPRRR